MMIRNRMLLAAAAPLALFAAPAIAATSLLTSDASYTGPGLDLSAHANGNYNFTFGPITVDQYTFTAAPGGGGNSGQGSVVGQGGYGLGANGSFGGDAVYIGVDSGTGYGQLMLNGGPVNQIGFFMNYAPRVGNNATIEALDINGNPFASYDLTVLAPISTPGGFNQFEFRGISSDAQDIYGLRFGGNYILVTGTADGIPTPAVPEPATWAMMLLGFGAMGYTMRRRRNVTVSFA
ncbi:MAG TPA: PEPxxWA-CTERM sorting domain-containing protein [Sphingobium sp.]|nr:PEPxxWA-CTERM sorting domain-containing protein [Sphingobium sp.]